MACNCGQDTLTLLMCRVTKRDGGGAQILVPGVESVSAHVKNMYVIDKLRSLQQVQD